MHKQITIEDLIHEHYYETDVPELLITENSHIPKICKHILESAKPYLKKNFKQVEFISLLEEDRNLIELFTNISDKLLCHMMNNIGNYNVQEEKSNVIHPMWHLNK